MLSDDILLGVETAIELNPSSHIGYRSKHAVLNDAHRYDGAIKAFKIMHRKLENAPDTQTQSCANNTSIETERAIQL
ncbi:hypothetical protein BDR07DRAFT_1387332 [Suillus spraguei]|nr:hypothetical protein BDR07DRAFT_1387332 [Suillus spraguei]